MAVIDFHVLTQAVLYFVALIAGLVISIPVGVVRIQNKGACLLYAEIDWKTDNKGFIMHGSDPTNCNFPIYYSVFALIFYGLAMGVYHMYAVCKSRVDTDTGSQMWVVPFILVNTIQALVVMIVACMLSVGFSQFCNGITENGRYKKCSDTEKFQWKKLGTDEMYDPGHFVELMTIAQVAAWSCVLVWILQVALSILRFIRNRKKRSAQMINNAQQSGKTSDTSKFAELEPTA